MLRDSKPATFHYFLLASRNLFVSSRFSTSLVGALLSAESLQSKSHHHRGINFSFLVVAHPLTLTIYCVKVSS
jgi:hypothetical protein